ncbi:hypothetical protein DFA_04042 [Cavenderia fasciculata]|uniref:Uncharacterized protein n=1 Tax=Cavenderia fasciculata TaxID=261658 RepID=F4Q147_CACFS|nr:uncharacterized protein DFA_04042 [Cavenderia fasciculata]EGG18548.1 hypothetical protein DFA_04042 [Cavenderia fasciculata]|eukprot:XP_004366452.1 hypothetical protein DFA_04042 [Cavenderia fasciculata]
MGGALLMSKIHCLNINKSIISINPSKQDISRYNNNNNTITTGAVNQQPLLLATTSTTTTTTTTIPATTNNSNYDFVDYMVGKSINTSIHLIHPIHPSIRMSMHPSDHFIHSFIHHSFPCSFDLINNNLASFIKQQDLLFIGIKVSLARSIVDRTQQQQLSTSDNLIDHISFINQLYPFASSAIQILSI